MGSKSDNAVLSIARVIAGLETLRAAATRRATEAECNYDSLVEQMVAICREYLSSRKPLESIPNAVLRGIADLKTKLTIPAEEASGSAGPEEPCPNNGAGPAAGERPVGDEAGGNIHAHWGGYDPCATQVTS